LGAFSETHHVFDDAGMKDVREWITSMEASLQKAEQVDKQYSGEIDTALAEYKNLTEQAAELDVDELNDSRQKLRPNMERDAMKRLQSGYMDKYKSEIMERSKRNIADLLGEDLPEKKSIHEQLRQDRPQQEPTRRKSKDKEQER